MNKFFKTSHGYVYPSLKRNPKRFPPILHLRNLTKTLDPDSKPGFIFSEVEELQSSKPTDQNVQSSSETGEPSNFVGPNGGIGSMVHISHPWPEWMDLMECLIQRGYFDVDGNHPFNYKTEELGSKEANCIRTACLNFGRDRYSLIRYFSKKDIQIVVGCGCPSVDRKVVNSGKRLRAHLGIHEGNVCSSCNLRGNCERAYVKAREDEGGRTVDVMRILLTYGLDPITGMVENKPCLNKLVKDAVRRLLKETVQYSTKEPEYDLPNSEPLKSSPAVQDQSSPQENEHINVPMKQGDWHCSKQKQPQEDHDYLRLKKGDWICNKCNFLNFAKNTRCLQCKENPPQRQLNPGEWECESCNYINFRRNMVCLKCDHRLPKASNASNTSAQPERRNGGYHINSGWKIKNDKKEANYTESVQHGRQKQNRDADMWRIMEEEGEDDDQPDSWTEISRFNKFPISERNRSTARTRENDDNSRSSNSKRRLNLLEATDDEEMAGWFGYR